MRKEKEIQSNNLITSKTNLHNKVQVLDVISHYKDIQDIFTLTLDSIMEKLHIPEDVCGNKSKNIFDELADRIENNLEK